MGSERHGVPKGSPRRVFQGEPADAPHGGPAAFARKAIAERDAGKTSVMILPVPWSIGLLMQAGAEIRYGGKVRWLEVDTGELCGRNAPQVIAVLRPNRESEG